MDGHVFVLSLLVGALILFATEKLRADFVAMICQQVDPDTLFFRRRLQLLGDTELGLECKNLLDRIGPERLPALLSHGLNWLAQQNMAQEAI